MKKIGLLCLCLASLSLVGCFHIPDEDWLLSKNKVNSGNTQKNNEVENAINGIMDGIDIVSSDWNDLKNNENAEIDIEELDENNIEVEDETISDEEISDDGIENEVVENEVVENEIIKEKIPSDE